jgi:mannose-1-phosphate guanylyltransferase/mannose-6-phosphate isomerase
MSKINITPVILSGGSGKRLWPLSRQHYPKQFIQLVGDSTLFQQSINRAVALQNTNFIIKEILIVTNENHRFLVLEQLDEMKIKLKTRIILEPEPKNTAPALTLAAFASQETDPDSLLAVMPADHYVKDLNKFVRTMHDLIELIEDNIIFTLGIEPTRPDTGFGYIHYEGDKFVKNVLSFKEKPDSDSAQKMITQGQHAWNGGIFILKSKTWLKSIKLSNSNIYQNVSNAWNAKNSDEWFERANVDFFTKTPPDSIDYAVMEKMEELGLDIKLALLHAGWSDLGSFNAIDDIKSKDQDGNIFIGDVLSLNTKNTIAITSKKNISLLGVKDLIVIETPDNVLVANKDDAQSIKELVNLLEKTHMHLLIEHTKVNRPWGWFNTIDQEENFKVKRIMVKPNAKLSYQSHKYRNEHWVVVQGKATIIKDGKEFTLNQDESTYIKKGVKHQLMNLEDYDLVIIEVQSGNKVIEEDIVRFKDIYGRLS